MLAAYASCAPVSPGALQDLVLLCHAAAGGHFDAPAVWQPHPALQRGAVAGRGIEGQGNIEGCRSLKLI